MHKRPLWSFAACYDRGGAGSDHPNARTPLGKPIVLLLRNGAYDQARSARNMREAGFAQVRRLRCCWYSHHVNWWGMTLLGERGRMDPGCSERTEEP